MNNLIKIVVNENQEQLVIGRELHEFLEIKTPYTQWFERMVGYGFVENRDFTLLSQKCETNNPKNPITEIQDHAIKLDMAKEIAMIQRSDKGKHARQYFIEVEKKFKQQTLNTQALSPTLQVLINLELKQKQMEQDISDTKEGLQGIREVVALNSINWRPDSTRLINAMASKLGDYGHIEALRNESYEQLEQRMNCKLGIRLTYKKQRQAENGVCKSKRDKHNNLDVIADDKKLIEGYVAIVKEMAIKYGVANTLN